MERSRRRDGVITSRSDSLSISFVPSARYAFAGLSPMASVAFETFVFFLDRIKLGESELLES